MKEELVFTERQHLRQWWIIALMIPINGIIICRCIMQLGFGKSFGNNPMPDAMHIIVTVITLLVTVLLFFIRLNTVINKEGVYMQMFPFHLRYKFTPWDYISEANVMKFNLMHFGGWGMWFKSVNLGGHGIHHGIGSTAYTMSGNKVLKLVLHNNKKIYIGTRMPEELKEFLNKLDAERKQK
ncbi:MAG: hypothetical protein LBE79_13585 [Tannerella sp.]|jgi:hypothetical protein|nr:hypothetical protein [Tannerella sp.]